MQSNEKAGYGSIAQQRVVAMVVCGWCDGDEGLEQSWSRNYGDDEGLRMGVPIIHYQTLIRGPPGHSSHFN
ncbi:unnamed protein product [Linum trigynum]|uniref:Uncharacterized protein n=1 Tax=Linum trigynum TaxID=586398 RepID=A0AAV2FU12_9ROSI